MSDLATTYEIIKDGEPVNYADSARWAWYRWQRELDGPIDAIVDDGEFLEFDIKRNLTTEQDIIAAGREGITILGVTVREVTK